MATEKQTIFKPSEMYELGHGDMLQCTFDFSTISIDDYEGFFNALPQLIYKKVKAVRFCNDFAAKLEDEEDPYKAADDEIRDYEISIKNKKPGYSSYLSKIIGKVLPRTKLLNSLEIDRIPLSSESFRLISDGIKRSNRIKAISFANTKVKNDDLVYFLQTVSPFKLEKISFINCGISSESYNAIANFLNQQPPQNDKSEWCLAKLNLDQNDFTVDQMKELYSSDKNNLNPGNIRSRSVEINGDDNANLNLNDEQLTKSKADIALEAIKKAVATVRPSSPTNDLFKQNENLKRELDELLFKVKAVKYNDDVYFIGENAQENLESIRAAETEIQLYEAEHGEIMIE